MYVNFPHFRVMFKASKTNFECGTMNWGGSAFYNEDDVRVIVFIGINGG